MKIRHITIEELNSNLESLKYHATMILWKHREVLYYLSREKYIGLGSRMLNRIDNGTINQMGLSQVKYILDLHKEYIECSLPEEYNLYYDLGKCQIEEDVSNFDD